MRTKNLRHLAAMLLAFVMTLSLAAPAMAKYEGFQIDAPLEGYDVKLNATLPAKLGAGAQIQLAFGIAGTFDQEYVDEGGELVNQADVPGYAFFAIEGLKFSYDPNMFTLAVNEKTGFEVTDNGGEVTVRTPDYFGDYNDADMPTFTLTVRDDITAEQTGYVRVSTEIPQITGPNTKDPMQYTTVTYAGGDGFTSTGEGDPGSITINPSDTTYTVTFDKNNDKDTVTVDGAETVKIVANTTIPAASIPSVTTNLGHYTFDGWYPNADGTGEQLAADAYTVTGDVTFYAKYTAQVIDVVDPDRVDPDVDPDPTDPTDPGYKDTEPADGPHFKEDYTGQIIPYNPDVYDYEVTYTNPDTGVTDPENVNIKADDGTFVIPGKDVTENLDVTVTATLKGGKDLYVGQYAAGTAIICWERDKAATGAYSFQGHKMHYSTDYNGYVVIMNCSDDIDAYNAWKASLTSAQLQYAADGTTVEIAAAKDVNADGTSNLYDASSIMNIFRGANTLVNTVDTDTIQEMYLRADLDHSKNIGTGDYAAWKN